ncbi:hypothetical protein BVX94_01715 [bacterium B17]|nr:hypothetical protein BVX94_01715 [bacterium B17]
MQKIQLFNVAPSLPEELEFLETLSYNMWWCWNTHAIELLRRIDPVLWKKSLHNPFLFFNKMPQDRLEALAKDKGFMTHYRQVEKSFQKQVLQDHDEHYNDCIAYFSLEYGIHESLRLYSGGLGVLAGDHLKSASDMNVPVVAVGLFYRCGYFQQYLNQEGWQQEACVENEIHHMPMKKALDSDGNQVQVEVPMPDDTLMADVWRVDVGRVPLFLLNTNVVENSDEYKNICTHLYDSDRQIRLRQELLLGIGGFKALLALGYDPPICHMNEGHAAFISLARIDHLVKDKQIPVAEAQEMVARSAIFTTHTPVPAGNESFSLDLVKPHLDALQKKMEMHTDEVISWGQEPGGKSQKNEIGMTILALRMSRFANGVSKLHGNVSRDMWAHLWPERPKDEIPINHITNGIHVGSWLSTDNAILYDRYIGLEWRSKAADKDMLERVDNITDDELWRAHELGRSRLVRAARESGERQLKARNSSREEVDQIKTVLNQGILTIGFARRFATYKRATLLLRDRERLKRLLSNEKMPVQMVFAGKAHPADDVGKGFIKEIIEFARHPETRHRIIFLENYDIQIARALVQGVDVWLNTPRRPQEASGTSGMKATINGALHLSILDGWWEEGYSPECGWAIGSGEDYTNTEYQDTVEAQALYNLLENEVVPRFYNRPDGDIPSEWITMMKESIKMSLKGFTSNRMVGEYDEMMYKPAMDENWTLWENDRAKTKELVKQHKRLNTLWKHVSLTNPTTNRDISNLHTGDKFEVSTTVQLGELKPEEVDIEVYYGPVSGANKITKSHSQKMTMAEDKGNGTYLFRQEITCETTGRFGMTTRATPSGKDWRNIIPGFITWSNGN